MPEDFEAAALLGAVMGCAPAGIALVDGGGLLAHANERWHDVTGSDPEDGLGRPWDETLHPGDRGLRPGAPGRPRGPAEVRALRPDGDLRWEEFAWLMPQTPLPGAAAAAERLRAEIGRRALGPVERLTASFGVAELTGTDEHGSDLFRRADRALYRAKAAGRDRTMVAAAPPPPADR